MCEQAHCRVELSSSSQSVSQSFAMHLLKKPPDTLSTATERLQSMFMEYTKSKPRRRQSHKNVARRIKFVGNEINYVHGLPADLSLHHIHWKGTLSSSDPIRPRLLPKNATGPAVSCTNIASSMKPSCSIHLDMDKEAIHKNHR